jgi:hypothetical protein
MTLRPVARHVYALSNSQMAQFDAMVKGEAVRTSVTCVIYAASGLAEQLACTTYCPPGAAPGE